MSGYWHAENQGPPSVAGTPSTANGLHVRPVGHWLVAWQRRRAVVMSHWYWSTMSPW
jgi:hypothetical protein